MIGSFYDPALETGCAFEELISFHGGIGGPQTRPFILHPAELAAARRARSSAPPPCTRSCSAGGASSTAPPRRREAGHAGAPTRPRA